MSSLSRLVGAVIVGVSVWCAAGATTVASAESPVVRLAIPASPLWAIGAFAAALAVPGWRRPILAAPALFATLPWLPVPIPAAFLLFTGPMAWWPIGLAVATALSDLGGRAVTRAPRPDRAVRDAIAAGVLTGALAVGTAVSVAPHLPGGDEPHYLVIADSLLRDGDLRIENNHAQGDYRAYFGGEIAPHFVRRGQDGEIYSIHSPGVAVVVLPAFAAAGYRGAQATIIACAALTGALVWLTARRVTGQRGAAWFAWAAVTLTPTALLQAVTVFPDGPGALAAAAGLWLAVRLRDADRPVHPVVLVAVGCALAALPWLHTRFSILAAGLAALVVWRVRTGSSPGDVRRRLALFGAIPVVAAGAWFACFWLIYGTPNPAAPYGGDSGSRLAYVPGGLVALAFDQQFGLLAYSPVLGVLVFGLGAAARPAGSATARVAVAIAIAYAAGVATYWMWWAGLPAPPARFLTAVLPLLAVPVARAWAAAGPAARGVMAWLLATSAAVATVTVGVGRGELAWNTRDAQAAWLEWLSPVANLPRAWPSFFWEIDPSDLSSEWPFARHVVVAAGLLAAALVGAGLTGRRGFRSAFAAASVVAPAALMLSASIGWALNRVNGLDPARSQIGVLGAASSRPPWRIGPWAATLEPGTALIRIRPDEPGRAGAGPAAIFQALPAGRYDLDVAIAGAAPARIDLRIGRSRVPLRSVDLAGPGQFTVPLRLPAGAEALVVEAGDSAPRVTLRVGRPLAGRSRAVQSSRFGDVDVFFLDRGVFVEEDRFWVRGSSSAAVVLVREAGPAPLTFRVLNGPAANRVFLDVAGRRQTWQMGPDEERQIEIPLGPAPTEVTLQSEGGFRPSDHDGSDDRRWLGARVEFGAR